MQTTDLQVGFLGLQLLFPIQLIIKTVKCVTMIENKATVPAVVDVFCSVIGRYVIYHNERFSELKYPHGYSEFAFVDLCEVEVYGKRCWATYIIFLKCHHEFSNTV